MSTKQSTYRPGRPFYAPLSDIDAEFWVVLIVPLEILPKNVRNAKQVQLVSSHPCWAVGKENFVWIRQKDLRPLEPIQRLDFRDSKEYDHFSSIFDLIASIDERDLLVNFEPQIIEDARKIDERNETVRKRKRESKFDDYTAAKRQQIDSSESNNDVELATTSQVEQDPESGLSSPICVNSDEEEEIPDFSQGKDDGQAVTVYVGQHNKKVMVGRNILQKSRVLSSYITEYDTQGSYIMRPQLMSVEFDHFMAILQFMYTGKYDPKTNMSEDQVESESVEAVSKEVVKAGKLYVLAQYFQIDGMAPMIYQKMIKIDSERCNLEAQIEFASIIFGDHPTVSQSSRAKKSSETYETTVTKRESDLDDSIITLLAWRLPEIMCEQPRAFVNMAAKTSKKNIWAKVMQKSADLFRHAGRLQTELTKLGVTAAEI